MTVASLVSMPLIFVRDGKKQQVGMAVVKEDTYEIVGTKILKAISLTDEEKEILQMRGGE